MTLVLFLQSSPLKERCICQGYWGSWPTLVNRGIDELFRLIERARILGNPMSISSSFTKVGHEPFHERNLYNSMGPIRPAHGVYNAKPSISFTSQSRERGCLFLPALKGSCMISRCTPCLVVL